MVVSRCRIVLFRLQFVVWKTFITGGKKCLDFFLINKGGKINRPILLCHPFALKIEIYCMFLFILVYLLY